jgi:hypothetical protein
MAKSFPGQFKKEKTSQKNGSKNKVPNALKRNTKLLESNVTQLNIRSPDAEKMK